MDINPAATMSMGPRRDKTQSRRVRLGAQSYVAFNEVIVAHDMV
jgi:hypothetical protein